MSALDAMNAMGAPDGLGSPLRPGSWARSPRPIPIKTKNASLLTIGPYFTILVANYVNMHGHLNLDNEDL